MTNSQPQGFLAAPPTGKVPEDIASAETLGKALDAHHLQAKAEITDATMFLNEHADQDNRLQAYNQAAASLAWDRTLVLLKRSSTL